MEGVVAVGAGVVVGGVAGCEGGSVVGHGGGVCEGDLLVWGVGLSVGVGIGRWWSGRFVGERVGGGPELGDFLVEDQEESGGDAVGDGADDAETAGEGADGVGGVDGEGALEDVEAEGAGVGEDDAGFVASGRVGVADHVWEDFVLQPAEDAVGAWEGGAVRPVGLRCAAVCFVEV